MAKWGEGDPRWLVEDRPDATNVNNWHWTEKNASIWSKTKLTQLLVGLKIYDPLGICEITEMSKCEGDAAVNNRKAKLIFFYEWSIQLKWKATPKDDAGCCITGTFDILNLSEEHEIKDVDVVVRVEKSDDISETFKKIMLTDGTKIVKLQLAEYIQSLKEEFSKGVILPTKETSVSHITTSVKQPPKRKLMEFTPHESSKDTSSDVSDLKSTEIFKCKADELYRLLTIKEMAQIFTRGECILEAVEGGKFEFYGGNVCGHFTKLVPNQLIKQKWRFKSWPTGHYSDVTIEIKEKSDHTELVFTQTGIPTSELDRTNEGWKRYYWNTIKRLFGFGASLY